MSGLYGMDGTVIPEQSAYKSHRRAVLINLNTDVDVSNWFEFSLIFVKEYFNLSKKNSFILFSRQ